MVNQHSTHRFQNLARDQSKTSDVASFFYFTLNTSKIFEDEPSNRGPAK